MSTILTGQSVGVLRYDGKCSREINGGGEGKAIFQSPEHAVAWMQEQATLRPREWQQLQNVYKCPYFDHYHLTRRQVVTVNGVLVEEGNKASVEAASAREEARPMQRQFRKTNGDADADAIVAAYRGGISRKQIADKSDLGYGTICRVLKQNGCGIAKGSNPKSAPAVRHVPATMEEIAAKRVEIEAQLRKLEEDEARLIEMNRLRVEWHVEGVSVAIRKHTDSLTLRVEDCRSLLYQLEELLTVHEVDAA